MPVHEKSAFDQINDVFVRDVLSYGSYIAQDIFVVVVPEEILSQAVLESIEERVNFLAGLAIGWRVPDHIYEGKTAENGAPIIFVIEHESSDDRQMAHRFADAIALICAKIRKLYPWLKKRPLVVPVVLAHSAWTLGVKIKASWLYEDFDLPPGCKLAILADQAFYLLDVSKMTNKRIRELPISATVRSFLFVLKNARNSRLASMLVSWRDVFAEMFDEPGGNEIYSVFLEYMGRVSNMKYQTIDGVIRRTSPTSPIGALPGSMAATFIDEGRVEGRVEGRTEQARSDMLMLLEQRFPSFPSQYRATVGNASVSEIRDWMCRIFAANTIHEVFDSKPSPRLGFAQPGL